MRIITDRQVSEGERVPRGWGIAYRRYDRRVAICYPIPLNWLVGLGRELWFRLLSGPERFSTMRRVYEHGYRRGEQDGRRSHNRIVNSILDEKQGEYWRGYGDAQRDALEGLRCLVEQQNESPTL